jgi:RNA polymerase sigma-70 factor (ECF subfamily)
LDQFDLDIELVKRLQAGDVEAFDSIYEKYAVKLFSFGLKYLKSPDEAEEMVQSVFLKIWENHKQLNNELSFKSYIFTIAYNNICKLFRRRNYQRQFIAETLYKNSQSSNQPEEGIDFQSTLTRVQQIIEKLPERQKEIFKKSRLEGKTTREIAAEIGLSPGTIDNYISESIKFIRNRICREDIAMLFFLALFFS